MASNQPGAEPPKDFPDKAFMPKSRVIYWPDSLTDIIRSLPWNRRDWSSIESRAQNYVLKLKFPDLFTLDPPCVSSLLS